MASGVVKIKTRGFISIENQAFKQPSSAFCLLLKTIPLVTFPALFPDDTLRAKLAIAAWIGAGFTVL
jgi:hypothetical protein